MLPQERLIFLTALYSLPTTAGISTLDFIFCRYWSKCARCIRILGQRQNLTIKFSSWPSNSKLRKNLEAHENKNSPQTNLIKLLSFCSHDWVQLQNNAIGFLFSLLPIFLFINSAMGLFLILFRDALMWSKCSVWSKIASSYPELIVVYTSLVIFFPWLIIP